MAARDGVPRQAGAARPGAGPEGDGSAGAADADLIIGVGPTRTAAPPRARCDARRRAVFRLQVPASHGGIRAAAWPGPGRAARAARRHGLLAPADGRNQSRRALGIARRTVVLRPPGRQHQPRHRLPPARRPAAPGPRRAPDRDRRALRPHIQGETTYAPGLLRSFVPGMSTRPTASGSGCWPPGSAGSVDNAIRARTARTTLGPPVLVAPPHGSYRQGSAACRCVSHRRPGARRSPPRPARGVVTAAGYHLAGDRDHLGGAARSRTTRKRWGSDSPTGSRNRRPRGLVPRARPQPAISRAALMRCRLGHADGRPRRGTGPRHYLIGTAPSRSPAGRPRPRHHRRRRYRRPYRRPRPSVAVNRMRCHRHLPRGASSPASSTESTAGKSAAAPSTTPPATSIASSPSLDKPRNGLAISQGDEGSTRVTRGPPATPGQRPPAAITAELPKLIVRVRFSSPAPHAKAQAKVGIPALGLDRFRGLVDLPCS